MFDWARGSILKQMIARKMFRADWNPGDALWLKNWSSPWIEGLIEFRPGLRVLDVGASTPLVLQHLYDCHGIEGHALDVDTTTTANGNFGFPPEKVAAFPHLRLHYGLAGDEVLPAETFDLVLCISTLEHTYDRRSPLDPEAPFAHVNALRDMVRMLKPGGLLLMNWDTYLEGLAHHVGWDFEVDYRLLRHCGLSLVNNRRRVRGEQYLFDHPDSLFFASEVVLEFNCPTILRAASINMLFRKPGRATSVPFRPDPVLEPYYFPGGETVADPGPVEDSGLSTDRIDARFRRVMDRIAEVLGPHSRAGALAPSVAA
jgi:SAM-dependent methyltransferase